MEGRDSYRIENISAHRYVTRPTLWLTTLSFPCSLRSQVEKLKDLAANFDWFQGGESEDRKPTRYIMGKPGEEGEETVERFVRWYYGDEIVEEQGRLQEGGKEQQGKQGRKGKGRKQQGKEEAADNRDINLEEELKGLGMEDGEEKK